MIHKKTKLSLSTKNSNAKLRSYSCFCSIWLCLKWRQWTCRSRRSVTVCSHDLYWNNFFDPMRARWKQELIGPSRLRLHHKPVAEVELGEFLVVRTVNQRISKGEKWKMIRRILFCNKELTPPTAHEKYSAELFSVSCCRKWTSRLSISRQSSQPSRHRRRSVSCKISRPTLSSLSADHLRKETRRYSRFKFTRKRRLWCDNFYLLKCRIKNLRKWISLKGASAYYVPRT